MSAVRRIAVAVLLAGPVAIAFFTGGYLQAPRLWAGLVAWALVLTGLLVPGRPGMPRGHAAWLAVGGLGGLAAWTLLSTAWAPVAGDAWHAGQLAFLYLGALLAAAIWLRAVPGALRWVEPAVAAGALIVVGYGLSERLLPGVLEFARSQSARGRLEQPLTYWNAVGAVAALGVVLCARVMGDRTRPAALRAAAAAAVAPLGMGLWLTVSRGALFACIAGLLALVVAAATREQLRAAVLAVATAALAAAAAAPFDSVTSLAGPLATRETEGAVAGVALLVVAVLAAVVHLAIARRGPGVLALPRHAALIALGLVIAGFVLAVAVGGDERNAGPLSPGATRYATLTSNRYTYWKVAAQAFEAEPVRGVGAAGWAVWWLRLRPFEEGAQDAHSLYVQTAAELGLVGLALLAAWLAGMGLAARNAVRARPQVAAGLVAGCVVWAAHVALDWDWQMPAVTLPVLVLGGALLAAQSASAMRGASRRNTQTARMQVPT